MPILDCSLSVSVLFGIPRSWCCLLWLLYLAIDKQRPHNTLHFFPTKMAGSYWDYLEEHSPVFWSDSFVLSRLGELIRHLKLPAKSATRAALSSLLPTLSIPPILQHSSSIREVASWLYPASAPAPSATCFQAFFKVNCSLAVG